MKLRTSHSSLLFIGILLSAHVNIKAQKPNEGILFDQAINAINIGNNEEIFEHFLKQRSAPLPKERRAFYKKELINRKDLAQTPLLDSASPEAQVVFNAIKPVIARYKWEDAVDVVVIDQKAPFIGMYRESIFLITTSLLKTLTPAQIRASFAHELAHACFVEELIAADQAQNTAAHHVVEYKCDLIAALALAGIGQDPFTLIEGVARIEQYYKNTIGDRPDSSGHPESPQRRKCLQRFLTIRRSSDTSVK